jgi:hypothetical protein
LDKKRKGKKRKLPGAQEAIPLSPSDGGGGEERGGEAALVTVVVVMVS